MNCRGIMMVGRVYEKKLSATEAKRRFVYIDKAHRDLFPPSGVPFKIILGGEELEVTVDKTGRIWCATFWKDLPHFKPATQ